MKFPQLFGRTPGYKRFSYEPRFYDPKAEERREREDRIRQELAREGGEPTEETTDYRSRMTGAFHSARKRSQASPKSLNSSLIRLGIFLFITLFLMAFMTWGKVALYSFLIFIPLYIYLKFKK
jgi:ABC-type multidrug transport system fused ATPase/permease subunit